MEVDHFDPRQKKDVIQNYKNLLLATRHCKGAKTGSSLFSVEWDLGMDSLGG